MASRYLLKKGYSILKRNFRSYYGEIDIVAFDPYSKTVVFVEVKLRKSGSHVMPEEAVTQRKVERVKKAAFKFLSTYKVKFESLRFDVIGIEKGEGRVKVNHIENAF
ncbi:YraN family protein [Desulfurobacterium sp.]